jgi:hypothetical protein
MQERTQTPRGGTGRGDRGASTGRNTTGEQAGPTHTGTVGGQAGPISKKPKPNPNATNPTSETGVSSDLD